mgnify:CR=1 FL=1
MPKTPAKTTVLRKRKKIAASEKPVITEPTVSAIEKEREKEPQNEAQSQYEVVPDNVLAHESAAVLQDEGAGMTDMILTDDAGDEEKIKRPL